MAHRPAISLGLTLVMLFSACGETRYRVGTMRAAGGAGTGAGAGADDGAAGGLETTSGDGGEKPNTTPMGGQVNAGAPSGEAGGTGVAGAPSGEGGAGPWPPVEVFEVLVPAAPPSEVVTGEGALRTRFTLEPTDVVTTYPYVAFVDDRGAVVAGAWAYAVYRPSTTASYTAQLRAFRWTLTGTEPLVDLPGSIANVPIGLSSDGAVVLVVSEDFAGQQQVCRWTEQTGCVSLGHPGAVVRFEVNSCRPWHRQSHCVSRNGDYLTLSAATAEPGAPSRVVRWSSEAGWEIAPSEHVYGVIDDSGNVLLSGQGTPELWEMGSDPRPIAEPYDYEGCTPLWQESGTRRVGSCQHRTSEQLQTFEWVTAEQVEPWLSGITLEGVNVNGTAAVGSTPVASALGTYNAAVHWSERDGLRTVFDPEGSGYSVNSVRVSDDGKGLFGQLYNPSLDLEAWFRWSDAAGSSELALPQGAGRADVRVSSLSGTVLGGQTSDGSDFAEWTATLWDDQGEPRVIVDEIRAAGYDLADFHPEHVLFIGEQERMRVVGSGRWTSAEAAGPSGDLAGTIFVAHFPQR